MVFSDGSGALDGRCETKHPSKSKSGCIRASWKDVDGDPHEIGGWQISGSERCVYRIIAEFPPAIPLARYHRRILRDVYQPTLKRAAA